MAISQSIQVGDEVPVVLQLVDGASNLHPQAEVRDNEANLLVTLNLTHQANGIYVPPRNPPPHPYIMPDEIFIKVTYIVYTDVGHGTESDVYERDMDIFTKKGTSGGLTPEEHDMMMGVLLLDDFMGLK